MQLSHCVHDNAPRTESWSRLLRRGLAIGLYRLRRRASARNRSWLSAAQTTVAAIRMARGPARANGFNEAAMRAEYCDDDLDGTDSTAARQCRLNSWPVATQRGDLATNRLR
jgi:hypothetical protein